MRRIHIAAGLVQVGSRIRQLCGWCGERLIDMDMNNVAVYPPPALGEEMVKGWEPGALVVVDGPTRTVLAHADGAQLPAGWCGDDGPRLVALPSAPKTDDEPSGGTK